MKLTTTVQMIRDCFQSVDARLQEWYRAVEAERKKHPEYPDWCKFPAECVWVVMQETDLLHVPENLPDLDIATAISGYLTWSLTKGIYSFDPDFSEALGDAGLTDQVPSQSLSYLPEWCVVIETPGLVKPSEYGRKGTDVHAIMVWRDYQIHAHHLSASPTRVYVAPVVDYLANMGFFALETGIDLTMENAVRRSIQQTMDALMMQINSPAYKRQRTHLLQKYALVGGHWGTFLQNEGTFYAQSVLMCEMMERGEGDALVESLVEPQLAYMSKALPLILYLCSDGAEIEDGSGGGRELLHPDHPFWDLPPKVKRGVVEHRNRRRGVMWEVGHRFGTVFRKVKAGLSSEDSIDEVGEAGDGCTLRPHKRRGHWRYVWTGPKSQPEKRVQRARWINPTIINRHLVDDKNPLPAVTRPVRKD